MKNVFLDIKTLIAELIGLFGGFFWAKSTNWDYEPLILCIISFCSLVITLYFHFFTNSNQSTQEDKKSVGSSLSNRAADSVEASNPIKKDRSISTSDLDPRSIQKEINNTQPFLKDQAQASYKGLKIKWEVTFESIRNTKGTLYHVTTLYKGDYPWIYFDIDIDQYPFLKIAKKKQTFIIKGVIINIGGNTFNIEIEEIHE